MPLGNISPPAPKPLPDIAKVDYYQKITAVPIATIARELLGPRITFETSTTMECDCPNHNSVSKRSLQISLDKGLWRCWGCDTGGDVLHLVEFIQSGVTTVKQRGTMPESHRLARDFLAAKAGLKPLGQMNLSERAAANYDTLSHNRERTFDALKVMAETFHQTLLGNERVLHWVCQTYGLTKATLAELKIGFARYTGGPTLAAIEKQHGITRRDALRTGLFWLDENHNARPTMNQRVIFPYWKEGRIVFMIGRIPPWAEGADKEPKYKKLLVYDPIKRSYVDRCIDNSAFFNEDCLRAKPKQVLITEGVTDCIAAMQHGFNAISPVTVRFRKKDEPRLIHLLQYRPMVYICLDNELSSVGLNGALQLAETLERHGIRPKIVSLPLGKQQQAARQLLAAAYGVTAKADPRDLKANLVDPTPERLAEADRLISLAKIDLNAYFTAGYNAADFRTVLDNARSQIEIRIDQLQRQVDDEIMFRERQAVLSAVAGQPEFFMQKYMKRIQAHYGKDLISQRVLRSELMNAKKTVKHQNHNEEIDRSLREEWLKAVPGSCREAMLRYESSRPDFLRPSSERLTDVIFEWFQENGGDFINLEGSRALLLFNNEILEIDLREDPAYKPFQTTFHMLTGLTRVSGRGREVIERLQYLTLQHGTKCKEYGWLHSVLEKYTVYFHLNTDSGEIAKITPQGVTLVANGANDDGVFLRKSDKIEPITFIPDVDLDQAEQTLTRLFRKNMACTEPNQDFLAAWFQCFLLMDFASTRPMTRFEGPTDSGKSNGVKFLTTLLYGQPHQKIDTDAARYSDAAMNPFTALDNVEVNDADRPMLLFLLMATTKIIREKRDLNTKSGTVKEEAKCLVATTGIEPLGEQLGELLTRLFTVRFAEHYKSAVFNEPAMIIEIRKERHRLLSAVMLKTARVLAMIERGHLATCMALLRTSMKNFYQKRANDYLSLMYLLSHCRENETDQTQALTTLAPTFAATLRGFQQKSESAATEGHPIALALAAFFRSHHAALEADKLKKGKGSEAIHLERYLLKPTAKNLLKDVLTKDLFAALVMVANTFRLAFPYKSNYQFAQRFADELTTIEKSGFQITRRRAGGNRLKYTITLLDDDALGANTGAETAEADKPPHRTIALVK